jgi:hypothetical protein
MAARWVEVSAITKTCYQIWQRRETGEVYSVRLEWSPRRSRYVITGVCGPNDPLALPGKGDCHSDRYLEGRSLLDLEERRDEFTILLARR